MRRKGAIQVSLAAIATAAILGAGSLAHGSGSCPNTGATPSASGASWAADPGLAVKTCGTWSTSNNQGHIWIGGLGGFAPQQTTPVGTVNGFYVAAGNDSVGNPDGGKGANTGCGWDERAGKYDISNDPTKPCTRAKSGPYVCVATNGGPAYGPKDGIIACPVNQP